MSVNVYSRGSFVQGVVVTGISREREKEREMVVVQKLGTRCAEVWRSVGSSS